MNREGHPLFQYCHKEI